MKSTIDMKNLLNTISLTAVFLFLCIAKASAQASPPSKEKMAVMTKTNQYHQLLADLVGDWTFTGKHTFSGTQKRSFNFGGTYSRKSIYDGRYFQAETTGGDFPMPWSEGKPVTYHEMNLEGYDNVKQKFVMTTINNETDTGIIELEGAYDQQTHTITYNGESTTHLHGDVPIGTPFHFHSLFKFIDKNHFSVEWKELINGKEVVTTQLDYVRK